MLTVRGRIASVVLGVALLLVAAITIVVTVLRRDQGQVQVGTNEACDILMALTEGIAAWALREEALVVVQGVPLGRVDSDMDLSACPNEASTRTKVRVLSAAARRNLWGGEGEHPALVVD
jgi:hypothetical protein